MGQHLQVLELKNNKMKRIVFFFAILISFFGFSQQIKVEYFEVRSEIATAKETLYIKDNKSVSIKDSLYNFKFPESTTHQVNNSKFSNIYFSNILKDNKSKEINFLSNIENINDVVFLFIYIIEKFD